MEHLYEKLVRNGESSVYPCHMPGHKRNSCGELPAALYSLDITEIEGFDDLHQPEGILLELQRRAARLCGAEESFYLINGSTCGILSAVSAALPAGGHILMARNCHRSAYHAAYLRNLKISYLYPAILEEYDICQPVTPEQVREALRESEDIGAVLVVSPTYEGRIADIGGIAAAAHEKGIPLIVDEAHGAHLGLSDAVHENSCRQGADLVIQSVHKTLPALTQTALLHVGGALIDRERLRRFLHIYQSSSPSYLLMASIDSALHYVEENGRKAFAAFRSRYERMMTELSQCRRLRFLPEDRERQDLGKLLISVKNTSMTGKQLYDILLSRYEIQAEMAAESFVLAMFTLCDGQEGYDRITSALLEIDGSLERCEPEETLRGSIWGKGADKQGLALAAAWDGETDKVLLQESPGRYAGEFVNLYPPGVPVLVPGERITEELAAEVEKWLKQGLAVRGIELREGKYTIPVLRDTVARQTGEGGDQCEKNEDCLYHRAGI